MQEMKIDDIDPNSLFERSPYKEAYFAARAICPLIVALVFLVMFVLKLVLFIFILFYSAVCAVFPILNALLLLGVVLLWKIGTKIL
jgi:hypothetical protein